jgi:NAD(P)-dependent dehydrogenase (short-subunit alcohol dehydrogenase family)
MFGRKTKQNGPRTALEAVEGLDLSGKVFVVTGAYSGLGAATSKALLSAGAKVILTGRNPKSQEDFVNELATTKHANGAVFDASMIDATHTIDLGSLASVRDFANYVKARYDGIDCLINNAGIMNTPAGVTRDGFEIQMGTNVIGHFLLAKILADITKRQVWLSSAAHALIGRPPGNHDLAKAPRIDLDAIDKIDEQTYDGWRRYQQSKLGDILLAKQFPVEYNHLKACAVHPGIVMTNVGRHVSTWTRLKFVFAFLSGAERVVPPEQGARTQTLCAVMPEDELVSGAHYANGTVSEEAESAKNMEDAKKLYDYCDEVTRPFQE